MEEILKSCMIKFCMPTKVIHTKPYHFYSPGLEGNLDLTCGSPTLPTPINISYTGDLKLNLAIYFEPCPKEQIKVLRHSKSQNQTFLSKTKTGNTEKKKDFSLLCGTQYIQESDYCGYSHLSEQISQLIYVIQND